MAKSKSGVRIAAATSSLPRDAKTEAAHTRTAKERLAKAKKGKGK